MFDAKGKEDNVDLGVHFGFAPQIETGGHYASFFGNQAAGAQIDMRQVYLTAGGTWGSAARSVRSSACSSAATSSPT